MLLTVFVIGHLLGNLSLFVGPDSFNLYTYKLTQLGALLYVIEFGLVAVFLIHAVAGISVYLKKRKARPDSYSKAGNAGGNSQKSVSSQSMIWTGLLLFVFTWLHLKTFKFGPHYTTTIDGVTMRDLYRLVIEVFQSPTYVIGYVLIMILLGVHLRHGFWSAFQSLGVTNPRLKPAIYSLGILISLVLAVGFLTIPVWILFGGGHSL